MCNARSVFPKIDEIRTTLLNKRIDIFACCETWLNKDIDDQLVHVPGFSCHREDRRHRIGGGVAVWIRDSIFCQRRLVRPMIGVECLFLLLCQLRILFVVMYIPPVIAVRERESLNEFIIQEIDSILTQYFEFDVILCGDLNKYDITFICQNLSLVNCNNRPTYGESELDYILLSESLTEYYEIVHAAPVDVSSTPHVSLIACPKKFESSSNNVTVRKVFDLRQSNIDHFTFRLCNFDWKFIFDDSISLDDKCTQFHRVLAYFVEMCIPVSFVSCTPRDKPWMTPVVKSLINARWEAFRRGNFAIYNHLKTKVKDEIQKAKFSWTKRMAAKNVWTAVHSSLGTRESNPIDKLLIRYKNVDEGVEMINQALSTNFQKRLCPTPLTSSGNPNKWNCVIDSSAVFDLLNKLNVKKSSFDIPNILYKEAAPYISVLLAHLFQSSINQRIVPQVWKTSAVTPVPKVSKPTLNDIRPISILPTPAKLLEILVLRSVKHWFMETFEKDQYGFRPGSSTLCALLSLEEKVSTYLDDRSTAGVVVMSYDLSKAFDKLPHHQIINRLNHLSFPCGFIEWVVSYLCQRSQFVRIGVHASNTTNITSGIPQGSIIGPLLFVATVGSYSNNSNGGLIKYADDTTLCFPLYKDFIDSSIQSVLHEHERFVQWSREIGLPMNMQKCRCLTVKKFDDCPSPPIPGIMVVDKLKVLGVTFNAKWALSNHIDQIISVASRRLYAMRILKQFMSKQQLKLTYNSMIRSYIEYCAPLFLGLPVGESNRLEKFQRRFHRIVCGKHCMENCLDPLDHRRKMLSLKFLSNVMSEAHILHCLLPERLDSGRFRLPPRRTVKRSNSFFLLVCESYNSEFLLKVSLPAPSDSRYTCIRFKSVFYFTLSHDLIDIFQSLCNCVFFCVNPTVIQLCIRFSFQQIYTYYYYY